MYPSIPAQEKFKLTDNELDAMEWCTTDGFKLDDDDLLSCDDLKNTTLILGHHVVQQGNTSGDTLPIPAHDTTALDIGKVKEEIKVKQEEEEDQPLKGKQLKNFR